MIFAALTGTPDISPLTPWFFKSNIFGPVSTSFKKYLLLRKNRRKFLTPFYRTMSPYTTKQCLLFFLKHRNESQLPSTMVLTALPTQHSRPFLPFAQLAPLVRRKEKNRCPTEPTFVPACVLLCHLFIQAVRYKFQEKLAFIMGHWWYTAFLHSVISNKTQVDTATHWEIKRSQDKSISSKSSFGSSIKCLPGILFSENFMLKNCAYSVSF